MATVEATINLNWCVIDRLLTRWDTFRIENKQQQKSNNSEQIVAEFGVFLATTGYTTGYDKEIIV